MASARNASTMCDPMNPAPPVTTIRMRRPRGFGFPRRDPLARACLPSARRRDGRVWLAHPCCCPRSRFSPPSSPRRTASPGSPASRSARHARPPPHASRRRVRPRRPRDRRPVRSSARCSSTSRARAVSPEPSSATSAQATTRVEFALALDEGRIVVRRTRHRAVGCPGDRLVRARPARAVRRSAQSRRAVAPRDRVGRRARRRADGDRIIARAPPDPRDTRTWPARSAPRCRRRLRARCANRRRRCIAGALWGERGKLSADGATTSKRPGRCTCSSPPGCISASIAATRRSERCALARAAARRRRRWRRSRASIAYAWLSGAHLPSQRAAVMVSVALLARACGARIASWNALALAALVVAALWPASVTRCRSRCRSRASPRSCCSRGRSAQRSNARRAGARARGARADGRDADRRVAAERGDVRCRRAVRRAGERGRGAGDGGRDAGRDRHAGVARGAGARARGGDVGDVGRRRDPARRRRGRGVARRARRGSRRRRRSRSSAYDAAAVAAALALRRGVCASPSRLLALASAAVLADDDPVRPTVG